MAPPSARSSAAGKAGAFRHKAVLDGAERWFQTRVPGESDIPPSEARPDELAIARALEAVNAATCFGRRTVKHAWAGLRSFVSDRAPVAGGWPEHQGVYFVAGQGGYGIQMAPALGQAAAEIVLDGKVTTGDVTAEELATARLRMSG